MIVILSLLKTYWKQLAVLIIISGLCIMAYSFIYNRGVDATNIKWEQRIVAQEKFRSEQITTIEGLSKVLTEQALISNENTKNELNKIYNKLQGKTLTIIKDGKCLPSQDFTSTYIDLVKEVNKK